MSWSFRLRAIAAMLAVVALATTNQAGATELVTKFGRHAKGSSIAIDHTALDKLLSTHVALADAGLNRVDYAAFKASGHQALKAYVASLEKVDVATLDRPEQFAFWANLYNAKTIDIVLDKYPVKSIKDISLGGTLLSNFTGGPWKAKTVKVAGQDLSLDDIEHGILRPIFKDPRVHYAVNCASVGCPNLGREAFTGAKLENQLEVAARAFVNAPRGVTVDKGQVTASSIYSWFQVDFGGSPQGALDHVRRYAEPALKQKLEGITTVAEFAYDWSINDVRK